MGKLRIRKKRRLRIQKQNIPIVILSSITIMLLVVWGGLYWKESTEIALIDPEDKKMQSQSLQELAALPPLDSKDVTITPVATGKVGLQSPKGAEKTGVVKQTEVAKQIKGIEQTEEAKQTKTKGIEETKLAKQTKGTELTQEVKQSQEPVTKSNGQSPNNSGTPKESESSGSIETETNSSAGDQAVVKESKEKKYEQELVKLQAKCMKDINVILEGAETSIPQLDKTNPVDVQTWQDHISMEISTAESTCERNYLDLIQLAEKDFVSSSIIEEWTQTYNALIVRLQDESRAKLQSLMAG